MELNQLEKIIDDQADLFRGRDRGLRRDIDYDKYIKTKQITVITGIRRCGKSVLLSQFADNFTDFHYVNFDDERLLDFKIADFNNLLLLFQKRSPAKVLFIDEIQNVASWERFIRRIHDEGYKIFITGSNAKLLSSELATHLTGRYLKMELYPFSFKEFLQYHEALPRKATTTERAKTLKHFDDYLTGGGFPDYVKYREDDFLKQVYENVLFKDLIVRFGIREIKTFRELAGYLLTNFTKLASYNGLRGVLNVKNVSSIKNYVGYMEESYLLFELFRYDFSLKKQYISEKKIYTIDNGVRNAVAFYFSEDKGRLLENLVFIELKRRAADFFFYKDKNECDFVIKEKNKITTAIQVCLDLSNENKTREVTGLIDALEKFKLKEGLILTYAREEELNVDDKKIIIMSAWKWLLGNYPPQPLLKGEL